MEVDINIGGIEDVDAALNELGAELGAKTLRSALRDAAKPYLDDMLDNAPESDRAHFIKDRKGKKVVFNPGFLKSRLKIRTSLNRKGQINKKFRKNDVAIARVGAFGVPYVGHVEFGTEDTEANPFIRNSARKTDEALKLFSVRIKHRIKLARKRLARKR